MNVIGVDFRIVLKKNFVAFLVYDSDVGGIPLHVNLFPSSVCRARDEPTLKMYKFMRKMFNEFYEYIFF